MMFDPHFWYWLADDGRVFSSERAIIVNENDDAYKEWLAAGCTPSPWPNDAVGEQTSTSLQSDLARFGVFFDLLGYAADVRWRKETRGIVVGGIHVATDDRSKQMIMGARIAASADPSFSTPWVGADGTIIELTAPQVIALSDAVLNHVQRCFAVYATVSASISASPPTITSRAQVDAEFVDV